MNIGLVFDTTLDSDAGVQQYFKGLARYLLEKGHTVTFLVPESNDHGEFKGKIISIGKTFTPKFSSTRVPISLPASTKKIKTVLSNNQFDIIHIGAPFSPFFGAKVVRNAPCPVVASYLVITHNFFHKLGLKALRYLLHKSYKKIDAHIALTSGAYNEAKWALPGTYTVIPGGVDVSKYSVHVTPLKKYNTSMKTILFVGRLEQRKGVLYLLKAFNLVKRSIPKSRLIIAGDGPERKDLEKLAKQLHLKDVYFEGYIKESLKPHYYSLADLCVFPAIHGESFGVVLVEALASGKVVLAFNNEGYKGVLHNLSDLLVEVKNVPKLAEKMIQFLKDDAKRKQVEKKCLRESKRFHWETVGKQIEHIYENLL